MRIARGLWIVSALLLPACGSSGDNPGPLNPGNNAVVPTKACQDYASAWCNKLAQCWPFVLSATYGDPGTCAQRASSLCANVSTAPGSSWSEGKLETCASALGPVSCESWWDAVPSSCDPGAGTLSDGASCLDRSQCTGDACRQSGTSGCGVCTTLSPDGGSCGVNSDCATGSLCTVNHKCAATVASGGTCDADHPCAASLRCTGGKCAAFAHAGDACDPNGNDCSITDGLYCDPNAKQCKTIGLVNAGADCGASQDGGIVACSAGASCVNGKCVAALADGAQCDAQAQNGPHCEAPAACIGGVCTVPGASCQASATKP